MKKFIITQQVDYIEGHLRYGHFEKIIEAKSLDEAKKLALKMDMECDGELIVDDYRIDDYGDLGEIEVKEMIK